MSLARADTLTPVKTARKMLFKAGALGERDRDKWGLLREGVRKFQGDIQGLDFG